jgi:hypothetical protein
MPQLTEADMAMWEITYRDGRPSTRHRAAYATTSDRSLPGQMVLKDFRHKVVRSVPVDIQLSVDRADGD